MTDVERITTTERHAGLRGELARTLQPMIPDKDYATAENIVRVMMPVIERERVRVVDKLVATIKAQLRFSPMARTEEAVMRGDPDNGDYILRAKLMEALEATREDND